MSYEWIRSLSFFINTKYLIYKCICFTFENKNKKVPLAVSMYICHLIKHSIQVTFYSVISNSNSGILLSPRRRITFTANQVCQYNYFQAYLDLIISHLLFVGLYFHWIPFASLQGFVAKPSHDDTKGLHRSLFARRDRITNWCLIDVLNQPAYWYIIFFNFLYISIMPLIFSNLNSLLVDTLGKDKRFFFIKRIPITPFTTNRKTRIS